MSDAPPGWPNWIGDMRCDGDVSVMVTTAGNWIVTPADGRPAVTSCPCCGEVIATKHAAIAIADHVYPATSV